MKTWPGKCDCSKELLRDWGHSLSCPTVLDQDARHFLHKMARAGASTTKALQRVDEAYAALRPELTCKHDEGDRIPGPRVPVRYGSFETEICCRCLQWRTTSHKPGIWHPLTELPAAARRDEDEDR